MFEVEATGKNIEDAIKNGLLELKASREDVDIKIIEQGGLFRKAKVLVSISEDSREKYAKIKKVKQQEVEETKNAVVSEPKKSEEKPAVKEVKTESVSQPEIKVEKKEVKQTAKTNLTEAELGKDFLENLTKTLNLNNKVEYTENAEEISYQISGEKSGDLIGYRGECLNAIQYIVSIINGKANRHAKKVRLDIDNFKERRQQTLEALAHRIAKKVEKTNHATKLEPMTAYERRIIHTIISEYDDVIGESEGEEPHRYLVIKPKKSLAKPEENSSEEKVEEEVSKDEVETGSEE